MDFEKRVAIITGAGEGIGFEIASQLAANGAMVILNDLDKTKAEEAAQKIIATGGICTPVAGNSGSLECIDQMIETAVKVYGWVDMAICNAGITSYGGFFEFSLERFQQLLEVNLQGTFFLAQKAAIQMRKQGEGGSILMISSVTGHMGHRNLIAYGMTKSAIEMMVKGMVVEVSEFGIRVNAVAPGATLTERTIQLTPGYGNVWGEITPLGKVGLPRDIANAALFLLSPLAGHITGQTLTVDGGYTSICVDPEVFSLKH